MGSLIEKLQYTLESIQDITKALEEKEYIMDGIELKRYGEFIRQIKTPGSGSGGTIDTINTYNAIMFENKNILDNLSVINKNKITQQNTNIKKYTTFSISFILLNADKDINKKIDVKINDILMSYVNYDILNPSDVILINVKINNAITNNINYNIFKSSDVILLEDNIGGKE